MNIVLLKSVPSIVESTGSPALAKVQAREQINPTIQKHLFITYALILMMIL
jgi:hypothetical protein